ncbi:unnamed protein product [Rangifer tarandus platyrhynchus]|uniref:Uncharacterized protein n=2 Tax=Rangifer tarandus platyrhynchus TaxID=3082113 RepID=A0ABN8Z6W1_RANTA|nr:unnamed protein product [Rangifer tarandus platyrhynchus]
MAQGFTICSFSESTSPFYSFSYHRFSPPLNSIMFPTPPEPASPKATKALLVSLRVFTPPHSRVYVKRSSWGPLKSSLIPGNCPFASWPQSAGPCSGLWTLLFIRHDQTQQQTPGHLSLAGRLCMSHLSTLSFNAISQ